MSIRKDVDYPGRWDAATTEYPMGKPKNRTTSTSKDGSYLEKKWIQDYEAFFGAMLNEAGFTPNGTVDTANSSQFFDALVSTIGRYIITEPINNDWNGYLDPEHTVQLENEDTSAGTRSFAANTEVALNLTFTANTNVTFASNGWFWLAGNTLVKTYEYTAEQIDLIDVNKVPVFIKAQDGKAFYFKNGDTGVTVSKAGTTLTVTLDAAIFGVTGIDKVWRFFVTDKVGSVVELSPSDAEFNLFGHNSDGEFVFYKDKRFKFRSTINTGQLAAGSAFDTVVNLPFAFDLSRPFQSAASAYSGNNPTDASFINAYVAIATQNSIRVGGRNVTTFNQSSGSQVTLILEGYLL